MKIVDREEIEFIDSESTRRFGIPSIVLMEDAGLKMALKFLELESSCLLKEGTQVIILAGPGKNGGDGLVVARHLFNSKIFVKVFIVGERIRIKGDALIHLNILKKLKIDCQEIASLKDWMTFRKEVLACSYIVDAIFGTGLKEEVRGFYQKVIADLNQRGSNSQVISMDVPSGLLNEEDRQNQFIVRADKTICIDFLKIGMLDYPGLEYVGELSLIEIGFPKPLLEAMDTKKYCLTRKLVQASLPNLLPVRFGNSHKGNYGHVLVIGGSFEYTGATVLACESALYSGCGLVSLASTKMVCDVLRNYLAEAICIELSSEKFLNEADFDLLGDLKRYPAIVFGPGLGRQKQSIGFLKRFILEYEGKLLIDADGLFLLKELKNLLVKSKAQIVITPHIQEMASLLNLNIQEFLQKKLTLSRQFARDYQITIVLKSAVTIIFASDGTIYYHNQVNDGMSSAGMGDVLSGILGSFMAQGLETFPSSLSAVFIHAFSARLMLERMSTYNLLASNVIKNLEMAFKNLLKPRKVGL